MKNIAVVCGGYSGEFEISIQSGSVVAASLNPTVYRTFLIVIRKDEWFYESPEGSICQVDKNDFSLSIDGKKIQFDAVFNAIHGVPGEDGRLQGYLDMLGIPYTSSGHDTASLTFNKDFCKRVVASHAVKVPPSVLIRNGEKLNPDLIIRTTGLPAFVKPNSNGSSVGVTKVKSESDLIPAIENALTHDHEILIETFIQGIEIGCSVMQTKNGMIVFPLTEIVSKREFFDYEAKYTPGMADEITPARIESADETAVSYLGSYLYKKLNCKGFVRFDFILQPNSEIVFLEVNTVPGISPVSILPQQAAVMGISLSELFGMALENILP
jgi:D-alanine-D-alanine ligase